MQPTSANEDRAIGNTLPGPPLADDLIHRKAEELEAVFESLGDGLLVVDASGEIVEANRTALTLLGYREKAGLLGPAINTLHARTLRTDGAPLGPDDLGLWRALRDSRVQRATCVLKPQFGGPRWIETVTGPIRDGAGAVLGASIVARDVTAQRRHERDLLLVATAADELSSAIDVPSALGALADRCVLELADWCAVFQFDGTFAGEQPVGPDTLRLAAMRLRENRPAAHAGGRRPSRHESSLNAEIANLLARQPARISDGFAGTAMRAAQPLLLPDLNADVIRRHAGASVEAQMAQRLGLRSIVAAPLRGSDGPVGALCVGWTSLRRPDEQDARLVDELARRASMAVEQGRFQRALEQALERLDHVLNSLGAGLMIFGGDGAAILVNTPVREMLGLTDDPLGQTLDTLLRPREDQFEDVRELDALLGRPLDPPADARGELRLRAPASVDLEWIAAPVRDETGLVLGEAIVWTDVTHIRAAERIKDDLAGDLSEALRSPLQAISTNAVQALRRGRRIGGDATLLHGLEVILRNARQISMHVNDLVDAARFDAATLQLDLTDVDLRSVIELAVDEARAMTTTHRFRLDVPPAMPQPRWDPDRVRQALLHILTNAIKYSPDGGQVSVRVRAQIDGAVISVRDRGMGIPTDEQERVFERFYRLAADPDRRKIRGNGLGLYLVRGVVEAHDGTVWIESSGEPGEGTTVYLLLPWQPGQRLPE